MASGVVRAGRHRGHRRALLVAAIGVVVVAIVAVVVAGGRSTARDDATPFVPPPGLPASIDVHTGQYAYRAEESIQVGRAGHLTQRYTTRGYAPGSGAVRRLRSDSPHCYLLENPATYDAAFFARLPTDVRPLDHALHHLDGRSATDGEVWALLDDVGELGGLESPRLRAALIAVGSRLPGVDQHRDQRDSRHRPALRLDRTTGTVTQSLYYDPHTFGLLETRETYRAWSGTTRTVMLAESVVDHPGTVAHLRGGLTTVAGMTEAPAPLESLDESWSTALAIVAHPDDLEYGTAAAVARWTGQGKTVVYALATSGEAGIDAIEPERCRPLREQEERGGAALVGVDVVEFLGHQDGVLEYGLPLRRDIARVVRRHRPDVVITGNYHDSWGPGTANQADHIALGRAVLDGVRDAGNRWVFRELLDEGLEPHKAGTLLVSGVFDGGYGVDVTDSFDAGVASLEAHAEYLRGLGDSAMADTREFLESFARQAGTRLGTRFGVVFDLINL